MAVLQMHTSHVLYDMNTDLMHNLAWEFFVQEAIKMRAQVITATDLQQMTHTSALQWSN